MELNEIVLELEAMKAIKFGSFKLKSGIMSPVYFDLRVMVSRPKLLKSIAKVMWETFEKSQAKVDLICGVPYTALAVAPIISVDNDIPSIIKRKEKKQYGTKKMIEGHYEAGQKCLIIEDVITSGASVLETTDELKKEGLEVDHVVVFLDREQGGALNLENNGIRVHSVVKVTELLAILFDAGRIGIETKQSVEDFLKMPITRPKSVKEMSLGERLKATTDPTTKRLFEIMMRKKSNLCLAADVDKLQDLLRLAEDLGPKIVCLKTHVDILLDWDPSSVEKLKDLAQKHDFLLFEDRKFADIGKTAENQFNKGLYNISSWADLVTVHGLPGPGVLDGLSGAKCKALVVAEMSSQGNLAGPDYAQKCTEMARNHENAIGVIAQSRLDDENPQFIQMTPGVQLNVISDNLGQQYNCPESAILYKGADVIIVGRGITKSENPTLSADGYRKCGWDALTKRFK